MTEYERLLDAVRARRQTRRQACGCAADTVATAFIVGVCFVVLVLIAIGGGCYGG
jgi:hypothetical protein